MRRSPSLAALLAFSLHACTPASPREPSSSSPPRAVEASSSEPSTVEPSTARVETGPVWRSAGGLRYLEIVRGDASPDETLPLVVFLHGLGDHPRAGWFASFPRPARFVLPEAPTPYGRGFSWFEYRAGDDDRDQGQLGASILDAAERLAGAIAQIRVDRPTAGAPIVTGFSQGGMLSYALGLHHPAGLGPIFPIAGALPEPSWPSAPVAGRSYPPISALHGMADPIVPYRAAEMMTQALSQRGFDIELQGFEGAAHTITPTMNALVERHLVAAADAAAPGAH